MSEELERCPYCGSIAVMKIRRHYDNRGEFTPQCINTRCPGRSTKVYLDEKKARDAWNRRENVALTANAYQVAALRTAPSYENDANVDDRLRVILKLTNGLMGLNGEAGEAIDILKKNIFHNHPLDREHLAKELGDIAWYLAITADALGYKLEDILQMNIDKLKARYPDGFDVNRSQHRDPNDI